MKKSIDLRITICFLIYYSYYCFMGLVFSQMSISNSYFLIPISFLGLILISLSLFMKNKLAYTFFRLIGILLATCALYDDLSNSLVYHTKWENIKVIITYSPVVAMVFFVLISFVRIIKF
jgi:hypothetical protein